MVRACLVIPLALVLIACVGSTIALECFACGGRSGETCDDSKPGSPSECASAQVYCNTQFNEAGNLVAKQCLTEAEMQEEKNVKPTKKGDNNCYSKTMEDKTLSCYCTAEHCNEKSMVTDYYADNSNGGGGGGSGGGGSGGKGSSSITIKPYVWTNLMWTGLVLASAFSLRMRAV